MMPWVERPIEEKGLLNPSFCAVLLWYAAIGHQSYPGALMLPFETSFLVSPMILHRETRESLPKTVATSLAVWLEENPLARTRIAERARMLVPFTREALSFGRLHGFLVFSGGTVSADSRWKKDIIGNLIFNKKLRSILLTSDTVDERMKYTSIYSPRNSKINMGLR